jgi:phosphoribosylformylglycinamidine cyclo-ligase
MAPEQGWLDYRSAGVDIDAGDALVEAIKASVGATHGPEVLRGLGHFGGFFRIGETGPGTTLVASADGVGTKLKVAVLAELHDHIGEDIVNHCINDILACGARPLFFLDYFATGKLDASVAATVVNSMASACRLAGVALLGGETAEMPGIYAEGDYDLAGFIVGVVDESALLDGSQIQAGDVLLGLPSDGFHTNGYSLIRAALGLNGDRGEARDRLASDVGYESGQTLGRALLQPHRSYVSEIQQLLSTGAVKGMAHITGGGLPGNVSRVIPDGLTANVDVNAWKVPPIFEYVLERGNIAPAEAFRVFNMGIGFVVVVDPDVAGEVAELVGDAVHIGQVEASGKADRVVLTGLTR